MKHVIITPVFNESKFLSQYIQSIVDQTLLPEVLLLVDDNSTDDSAEIIKGFSAKYDWVKYIYHNSQNKKSQGKKVINAFNFGVNSLEIKDIDFISKIDADLVFDRDYFAKIQVAFESDKTIGIAGGVIVERYDEQWHKTPQAYYHIRGALKSYRYNCFLEIGGLQPVLGWDGLDEMNAIYKGWKTQIIQSDVKHFRRASMDYDAVKLNYDLGFANWKNGGNLFLATLRAINKAKLKPFGRVGISYLRGYLAGRRSGESKHVSADLAKFINDFHFKRLFGTRHF